MARTTPNPDSRQNLVRFLALGDSYTIGEGVPAEARWPKQLATRLGEAGKPTDEPEIIAHTGWTTDELASALAQASLQGSYELVTLQIGVNNQYRGRSVEEYSQEFAELLEQAVSLAGGNPDQVLVLSIPDWGVTPFAVGREAARIADEIDSFNAVNREAAIWAGARYIDVTPISRLAADDPALVAPDGLHPSGKMYAIWVELLLPEALAALGE